MGKDSEATGEFKIEIFKRTEEVITRSTVQRYHVQHRLNAFHVIPESLKSAPNIEDRLWFCYHLHQLGNDDFMHLASNDEFFIRIFHRPNHQVIKMT